MNAEKIVLILGLLLSIIMAFAAIPYAGLVLVILGLALGILGDDESGRMFFFVMALALAMVASSLGQVPAVGGYLTGILSNISAFINAAVVAVIVKILIERVSK